MGLHQTKSFCIVKETINEAKGCLLNGRRINIQNNIQNMQRTPTTKHQKKNQITQLKTWAEDLNRHFPKENIQMANRHVKRYSISLIVGDVHIRTMM